MKAHRSRSKSVIRSVHPQPRTCTKSMSSSALHRFTPYQVSRFHRFTSLNASLRHCSDQMSTTGSYSQLKAKYGKLSSTKFPATNLLKSNLMKQSEAGREERAQQRIAEFRQYFTAVLLLNGECDGEDLDTIVRRTRTVHDTLGIDSVNAGKICAAMCVGLLGATLPEPEPEPEPVIWP